MKTYITALDLESDGLLHRFGSFSNASTARVVAGVKAGQLLAWRKDGGLWRAEASSHAYLMPVDFPAELQNAPLEVLATRPPYGGTQIQPRALA